MGLHELSAQGRHGIGREWRRWKRRLARPAGIAYRLGIRLAGPYDPDRDQKIDRWIDKQMVGKSCAIDLIGSETANRKWINREIVKAWDKGLGVIGINIHRLLNRQQQSSIAGQNPFDFIIHGPTKLPLSAIVPRYDPPGVDSKQVYAWISQYLATAVEEGIKIRKANI